MINFKGEPPEEIQARIVERKARIIPEKEDYIKILQNPELLTIINKEFDKKISGEEQARNIIFLVFNMRNVANLNKSSDNLMVNDEGGTGKDYVVSNIYSILPDEEKVKKVRISPKVLAYLNSIENNPEGWIKKSLYLEDLPNIVLNDDSFKVMSSSDPNGITQTSIIIKNHLFNIDIKGKPSIILTIATANPKPELLRRYPILNLTSTISQTKAILKKQGLFAERGESQEYDPKIKKALSYLERVKVRIPYATKISDSFPSGNVIIRTHFPRFLDYVKSSCSLHQYQREKDSEGYYLATEQDYEIAREMMIETTSNQLMIPLTKKQKEILSVMAETEGFTPFKELATKMQHIYQERWLRNHLERLSEMGFLTRDNHSTDDSIKPSAVYKFNDVVKLELPSFAELENSANNTTTTNNTNNTNNANKEKKTSPSNMNNLHNLNSELTNEDFELLTPKEEVIEYE